MSLFDEPATVSLMIHRNPFWVLGATTRDDNHRIIELADEKSLQLDDDVCRKARSDLITPRHRLRAEIAWLPGVSPSKARHLILALQERPLQIADDGGLPTLVRANLMASAFQWEDGGPANDFARRSPNEAAGFILRFSHLVDSIDPEEVLRDVNEDRSVSGFPEIRTVEQIESELAELRRQYLNVVKEALNRMPPAALVEALVQAVRVDTNHGEEQAVRFLDDLVDVYQSETKGFLDGEMAKIDALLDGARGVAKAGATAVSPIISNIQDVARNWVKVAEPIQLSLKSRGIEHDTSQRIAYRIRSLAIDLFNEHDLMDQAQQITELLQTLFAYVPDVAARVEEDADAIRSIAAKREKAKEEQAKWAREITYRSEVGLLFKEKLSISPDGVELQGKRFPLGSITRVRWGGVKHSVNGIPTGTNYTIAVGDNHTEAVISLRDSTKNGAFLECLWRAVCVRLMGDILTALRNGQQLVFGDMLVTDLGVTLTKHKMFGSNERVFCDWWQISVSSVDGSFRIASKDDKKTYSTMSYIYTSNAHLLEHLIRLSFKNPSKCLSGLLDPA